MKTLTALLLLVAVTIAVAAPRGLIGSSLSVAGVTPDSIARYDLQRTFAGAKAQKSDFGGSPSITTSLVKRLTIIPEAGYEASWLYAQWLNVEENTGHTAAMNRYRGALEVKWLWIEFKGSTPDTLTRTIVRDARGNWISVGAALTTEQLIGMFRPDPAQMVGNEYAQITVNRRKDATYTGAFAVVLNCAVPIRDSLQIWNQTADISAQTPASQPFYGWFKWWDLPSESQLLNTHVTITAGNYIPFRFDEYPQCIIDNAGGFLYYRGFGMQQLGYTIATNAPWTAVQPYSVNWKEDGTGAGDADADGTKCLEEDFHFYLDNYWPIKTRTAETASPAVGNVTLKLDSKGITSLSVKSGLRAAWMNDFEGVFAYKPYQDVYGVFGLTFTQRNAGTAPLLFAATDTAKLFRQYNIASRAANPWVYTITQGENGITGSVTNDSIDCLLPAGSIAWDMTPAYDHYTGTEDDHGGWYNHRVKSFDRLGQAASIYFSYDVDSTSKAFSSYEIYNPFEYRFQNRFALWREKGRRVNSAIDRTWWERYTVVAYTFWESAPTYTSVVDSIPLLNTKYYATSVGNATIPTICWGNAGDTPTEYSDSSGIADNLISSTAFYLVRALMLNSNQRYEYRHASWVFSLVGLPNAVGTYYEDVVMDACSVYFAANSAVTQRDEMADGDSIAVCGYNFGPGLYPIAQSPHDYGVLNTVPMGARDISDFTGALDQYRGIALDVDSIRYYMGDTLRVGTTALRQEVRCIAATTGGSDKRTYVIVHGYGTAKQPYLKIWRRLRVRT